MRIGLALLLIIVTNVSVYGDETSELEAAQQRFDRCAADLQQAEADLSKRLLANPEWVAARQRFVDASAAKRTAETKEEASAAAEEFVTASMAFQKLNRKLRADDAALTAAMAQYMDAAGRLEIARRRSTPSTAPATRLSSATQPSESLEPQQAGAQR